MGRLLGAVCEHVAMASASRRDNRCEVEQSERPAHSRGRTGRGGAVWCGDLAERRGGRRQRGESVSQRRVRGDGSP